MTRKGKQDDAIDSCSLGTVSLKNREGSTNPPIRNLLVCFFLRWVEGYGLTLHYTFLRCAIEFTGTVSLPTLPDVNVAHQLEQSP